MCHDGNVDTHIAMPTITLIHIDAYFLKPSMLIYTMQTKQVVQTYVKSDGTVATSISTRKVQDKPTGPRTNKRTDEEINEILEKRKNGATIKDLCNEYKMARNTYYKYVNRPQ